MEFAVNWKTAVEGVTNYIPTNTKANLVVLLKECLSMDPNKRPSFDEIAKRLESMTEIPISLNFISFHFPLHASKLPFSNFSI